jgi:hypothetical protein
LRSYTSISWVPYKMGLLSDNIRTPLPITS